MKPGRRWVGPLAPIFLLFTLLVLFAPASQRASQGPSVWITSEQQAQIVRSISDLLPSGWAVTRQELNRTPSGWATTDTRGFEIHGVNGQETFNVWVLPNDWIGIRMARPERGRYRPEVILVQNFKVIVDADYPIYAALQPLGRNSYSVSLVDDGQGPQTFRNRTDEVDRKTQELVNRFCKDQRCRDESAYSLIVLGVPAPKMFLDCAEHGSGEPQELCASVLKYVGDPEAHRVLERVVAFPGSSSSLLKAAAYSLEGIGDVSSGPALLQGLRNTSGTSAARTITLALEALHYEPAAPEILRQLELDPSSPVFAVWFVRALASLHYTPAIPTIQKLCRKTEPSAEWILNEAKRLNDVDLDIPEISYLRLTAQWGQSAGDIRILLVAPATIPETGRIQVAVLMENGTVRDGPNNSLLVDFTFGDVIVDGKVYRHPPATWNGSADLPLNAVTVRAMELPEETLDGQVHKLQFRAAGALLNTLTLRLPKP